MQIVLHPRLGAWALLVIPAAPIVCVGIYAVYVGAWAEGMLAVSFGIFIILYNASTRIIISADIILMKRYGLKVWSIPVNGTTIQEGRGGDLRLLPAYILKNSMSNQSVFILKSWFSESTIARLRSVLD